MIAETTHTPSTPSTAGSSRLKFGSAVATENSNEGQQGGTIADLLVPYFLEVTKELQANGFSVRRYCLLGVLAQEGRPLSMGEIAELMSHTTASTTSIVDRLFAPGYVRRVKGSDRRKTLVELTPKGREFLGKFRDDLAGKLSKLIKERAIKE